VSGHPFPMTSDNTVSSEKLANVSDHPFPIESDNKTEEKKVTKHVKWDEENLRETDAGRPYSKIKITEPDTPYPRGEDLKVDENEEIVPEEEIDEEVFSQKLDEILQNEQLELQRKESFEKRRRELYTGEAMHLKPASQIMKEIENEIEKEDNEEKISNEIVKEVNSK